MRRVTKRFALCLDNTGSEASLILGKVYRIVPDARAAKDDLLRVPKCQQCLNVPKGWCQCTVR
jgi:hypothetical protein